MKNVKAGSREMTESKVPKIGVGNKWSGKIIDEGGFGKSMFMLSVVSRYSGVSFMLNICMEIALYLQIMVLFVGIVHIFLFSAIL